VELMSLLKADGKEIDQSPVPAESLGELVALIAKGELTGKLAKEVLPKMYQTGDAAKTIVEREGLKAISDTGALETIVDDIIAKNPKQVEQYRGGKTSVLAFFVGQVMRATRGQADPPTASEILKRKLA
jgi:aspartyl-tRNA(Asn)/glutamyl-tRNA(Gln) amidotransferase subunit B